MLNCACSARLSMIPAPRLVCEQCKRRKTRCNKGSPCSACKSADLHCHTVQRARLPRGKSGKTRSQQNRVLEDRVVRIENLLAQQTGPHSVLRSTSNSDHIPTAITSSIAESKNVNSSLHPGARLAEFVAPNFWDALSEEVHGLREILEESDDDVEEENSKDGAFDGARVTFGTEAILFQRPHHNVKTTIPTMSPETRAKLLRIYHARVDSVYKILHWPTVLSLVEESHNCITGVDPILSVQCLETSIYFMALCSITNDEAKEMNLGDRSDVLQTYRSVTEDLLAKSSLLHSPDLTVLQAFVIYLVRFDVIDRFVRSEYSI
jgi:hypothetical protein